MTRPQHSIDGFIPRRPSSNLGERHVGNRPSPPAQNGLRPSAPKSAAESIGLTRSSLGLTRADIDDSLKDIDTGDLPKTGKRGRIKGLPKSRTRRIAKWAIIAFIVLFVAVVGWIVYRTFMASNNIFKGSLFGLIQSQPLKQDANGRSNILVLGTSEDDPGHGGAYLTDSMMIMSIDQKNKAVDMFSIPRDLYVEYGMPCNSGYQGKINEYFNCVNSDWSNDAAEEARLLKTRKFVGEIFGLDVQYAVHVNNTVIKEAVDAVDGVDVDIQGSNGAPGILDRNFDWRCNYTCNLVKYDNGIHHLDGKHALFLAMARGDVAPTYGLGNSNFDREKNQQKIIIALKQKAVSTGTLTDVAKVTKLIDALGKNLRTNFETNEIRTLMQLGTDIPAESIKTVSLYDGDSAVVTSGNYNGASVVMPSAGMFDYSDIQAYLDQKFSTNPVTRENAQIDVFNGSETAGAAQVEADRLADEGFIIGMVANAPSGDYGTAEIYQIGEGNIATKTKLESLYGVTVTAGTPPVTVTGDTKFVVIIGQARSSN